MINPAIMPNAGIDMTCIILIPVVSRPALRILPKRISLRKIDPKPTGIHM